MIIVYSDCKDETIKCEADFSSLSNGSYNEFVQSCQIELKAAVCIMLCYAEDEVKKILDERLSSVDLSATEFINGLLLDVVRGVSEEDLKEFREYGLAQEAVQSYSKYIS